MKRSTLKIALHTTLISGLLGFSSLGLAQSEAIRALNNQGEAQPRRQSTPEYTQANQLGSALDAFNRQDTRGRIPGDALTSGGQSQQVSHEARELSAEIDAYNANASKNLVPETRVPTDEHNPTVSAQAQELAAELTRYNATGGSLSSVRF